MLATPTRRRNMIVLASLTALLVVFVLANAWIAARATRAAHADVGFIVHIPGPDLQVTDTGPRDAPTLVLLHGWTESLHVWDAVLPYLHARLRIVRVDLPGDGGSEAPTSGYSIPDQALQVARALDVLQVRHATVVGHSMGGDIAVQLAAARPDIVAKLVLIDPPTAPGYMHLSLMVQSSLWPLIGPLAHDFLPDALERQALAIAVAPGHKVPPQMVADLDRVPWPAYEKGFYDTQDWIAQRSVPNRLRSLTQPRLLIWGARDQLLSPTAVKLYRGLPSTRIVVLPRIGHTPPIEVPAATAALLESFIRTQ